MLTFAPALTALAATLAVSTTPSTPAQYPIGVTRCNVVTLVPALPVDGGISSSAVNTLEVSFVNHAPVAAKDVRITVNFAGATQTIDDRGTFSPNVAIEHTFAPIGFGDGAAQCSVASVDFADGTNWQSQV